LVLEKFLSYFLPEINIHFIRHTPFRGHWPEGKFGGIITLKQSFSLLTQPSLFIFCLRPIARRWPGPSGELQATGVITQKRIVRRP